MAYIRRVLPPMTTLIVGAAVLLVPTALWGQTVPVAEGALGGVDQEWPSIEEMGVPLYPDLAAYMQGDNPGIGENSQGFKFVNFASQEDQETLVAWYQEHVSEGWVVDPDMQMLFPEGAGVTEAMAGSTPYVNIAEMETGCMGVPCKAMVQVVYLPK